MAYFEKHFSVEEANALLPELRRLLEEIRAIRDDLVVDWEQALPVLRAAHTNGGGREANAYLSDLYRLNLRLRRLAEIGVLLKDLDRGLVDFPAWRGDREVFLCWHLGEERVAYWHELEAGFAGRQKL